ncbi:Myb-like_DNA-binding domain-containing protein [Hexamita inflata]|uniref:Myb-like_DNA-binding domain-containing protein n=1 Tax=Hexamita inflata TaxID=28002 RepID=A0ABP1HDJ9_9EUKA
MKQQWTQLEKQKLYKLIQQQQTNQRINWQKIATIMENRTATQCKLQYRNVLSTKKESVNFQWTHEFELQLLELVHEYGTKWKFIQYNYFSNLNTEQIRLKYYYLKSSEVQYQKMFEKGYQLTNKDIKFLNDQLEIINICFQKMDNIQNNHANHMTSMDPLEYKIFSKDHKEQLLQLRQEEDKIIQLLGQKFNQQHLD